MATDGPYQYKNRGQNFVLTRRAALRATAWHGDGMRKGGAALMSQMVFNVCRGEVGYDWLL